MDSYSFIENGIYTANLTYTRDVQQITLFCLLKMGEDSYFDELEDRMRELPEGYYEGIHANNDEEFWLPPSLKQYATAVRNLTSNLQALAHFFDLEIPIFHIMRPSNWKNVDLSLEEFVGEPSKDGLEAVKKLESVKKNVDAMYALQAQITKKIPVQEKTEFDKRALKYILEPLGGQHMMKLRNKRLFDVLKKRIDAEDFAKLGLLYEINQQPGISAFLELNGFELAERELICAWNYESESGWSRILDNQEK